MNNFISIIVPCFKQAHFLDETLLSVFNQSYTNWECIIVNDGSPDNTEQIAMEWCNKDNRFKYLYKENGGLSSARNAGIKVSKGEFILPLDSDDVIDSKFLEKLVPIIANDSTLVIVSCFSNFFTGNISNIVHKLKPNGNSVKSLLFENNLISTSLYRKKCWVEVGGYDENMKNGFEDWEFWIAITKSGRKFKVVEEFLFFYRKSKKSMLTDTLENYRISNMEYVFEKHKDLYKENYDNSIKYLFFLVNMYRNTTLKTNKSRAYKIAKLIVKPFQ